MTAQIKDLPRAKVAIVGDCMWDRWMYGSITRISPEAPERIFLESHSEETLGGAANVAQNVKALGASAMCWGKLKADWPLKIRHIANRQQVGPRIDCEDTAPISAAREATIMYEVAEGRPNVIVISDYAKGVCTATLCRSLIGWAKQNAIKVVVDPKGNDWSKYAGASVVTPNRAELEAAHDLYRISPSFNAVLCTKGSDGMELVTECGTTHIPAASRDVADVCGAGDTVCAVLAAALAIGADLETAATWANAAAGVVVSKRQTATCSLEELTRALHRPRWMELWETASC